MTRPIFTQAAFAAAATAFVSSMACAESPLTDNTKFPGSNAGPWASQYDASAPSGTVTPERARSAYKMSRDEVNALNAEDSGSAYFARMPMLLKGSAAMGAPALDPSNAERDL